MARCIRILGSLLFFAAFSCAQTFKSTAEYINAPVNLKVTLVAAPTYELRFYSDNREGGFAGYGIFTGTSSDALNTSIEDMPVDISAAPAFCTIGAQATYGSTVAIQVGPAAAGVAAATALCDVTTLTLTSGSFVALRARVERTVKPWSAAAIAQVP